MSAPIPTATGAGEIAPSPLPPTASSPSRSNSLRDSEKGKDTRDVDYSHVPEERREAARQLAAMTPEEYAAFEKKTLWKMDLNIIPWITLLYLISFLDRVNVGAARLVGLMEDLKLTSLMFSNISTIFFVSYVVFEVPSNLVLKKFRPSRWIPFTMIIWAIFQTFMGLVKTYEQLLALRFCLGIFEAGLFPGLNLYLTAWYRREEINKRVAVFFAGAVLAGAFGGIFGYALGQMAGIGGLNGWCWIFIIEGLLTLVIGIASIWMVHDFPQQAKLLTPLEREFILSRLQREQGLAQEGTLNKRIVLKAFKDWKMYAMMLAYLGAGEALYSLALFAPTVIASLGTFTRPQSLLLSTPPYVVCFFTTIGTAVLSDKYKRRAPFLIFWSIICAIGYILLMAIPPSIPGAKYFAVFVATAGAGPMIATTISWTGESNFFIMSFFAFFCSFFPRTFAS